MYQYGNPPDHDVDRGDHGVPLGDEAVENVAVENGPHHSNEGEQGPEPGDSVLHSHWSSPDDILL